MMRNMASQRIKRIILIEVVLIVALAVVVGAAVGWRAALNRIKNEVANYLGGGTEIGEIEVTMKSVVLHDLRIPGGEGWPAENQLTTDRIEIFPNVKQLLKGKIEVGTIIVDEAYISVVRTKSGRLRIVPTVLEAPPPDIPPIKMKLVQVRKSKGEVFDYSVEGKKPAKMYLHAVYADTRELVYPDYNTKTFLTTRGVVDGKQTDGHFEIDGWLVPSTYACDLQVELDGIDLVALEPWMRASGDAKIEKGTFDLNMHAVVKKKVLTADGTAALVNVELERGSRKQKLYGVPAVALIKFMQNHNGRINLTFAVEENIDDPDFKVHAVIARALRATIQKNIGIDVAAPIEMVGDQSDTVEHVEGVLKQAGSDLSDAANSLFGNKKK